MFTKKHSRSNYRLQVKSLLESPSMPPYEKPGPGTRLSAKFIRVYGEIYYGVNIGHKRIGESDDIIRQVALTRANDPTQVDAGHLEISDGMGILVFGDSDSLQLPVPQFAQEARRISVEVFRATSPEREVREEEPSGEF